MSDAIGRDLSVSGAGPEADSTSRETAGGLAALQC